MPRFASPTSSRPVYYDRNPSPQTLKFAGGAVAPHAETQRATRTIPTNTKGYVELTQLVVERVSAAGTPDTARAKVGYTPSGGAQVDLYAAQILAASNTAGDRNEITPATNMFLDAGDEVELDTVDGSTTGTVFYWVSAKLTEFDA